MFEEALVYAYRLHSKQARKGSDVPYFAHLLGVTALVLEEGGDEEEAIAALLHDAVEDQGGLETLEEIRKRFGERVADMVADLSDAFTSPKPDWETRKVNYIRHLKNASPSVRRVALADKLYNAWSILSSHYKVGDEIWKRFNGGKEGTLWYYREVLKVFKETGSDFMTEEIEKLIQRIERLEENENLRLSHREELD